ncbi:MAG: ROK family protein [Eubacteriales bacterium]|nr:ROK family protein [Eubacteriales bacterium]
MTEKAGKNRSDYKRVNRGLVMKMIATGQCTSRVELVEKTGLSKMAISNIVSELLRQGLLIEKAAEKNGDPGRKPIRLMISPDAPRVVGLVITRVRCEAVLCSLDMQVFKRERVNYNSGMNREKLIHCVFQLLDTILYEEGNILAVGLASPGPVNVREGRILNPYYFYNIQDVEIVRVVSERYGLPVFFDHDNQSAVRVESLFGNGRGYQDILLMGATEGVGSGILSSDHLHGNSQGLSPELGHVSIDYKGKPCICGSRGCMERYVSTPEILRKLYEKTGKYYTYEVFCGMTEDPDVDEIFKDAVEKLAVGIISAVNILNSSLILLSNDFVYWDDKYAALLEERINRNRFTKWADRIVVKKTYFYRDASLMGAACNAVSPVFAGGLLFED